MKCMKIILSGLMAFAATANAMPTQEETKRVEPLVMDLMRDDQAALKSGKKTRAEVAESAMELADQAESEAAKLLLMKGAFNLYVRAGEFDKAIETLQGLQTAIPDMPPADMAKIIESSLRVVSRKNGGQLYRLLDETKTRMRYTNEAASLEKSVKRSPADRTLRTRLAEHYAYLGKWDKALENFAATDGKVGAIAKSEREGKAATEKVADFWWNYPTGKADELVKCFRTHAAKLYEAAIASGDIKGLNKVQAERRIGEAKEYGETNFCEIVGEDVQPFSVELPNADKIEFIKCPAGMFMMGWPAEDVLSAGGHKDAFTPHRVKITRPFLLSKWAVTRKQWSAIMGENDYEDGKKRIPNIASARVFFNMLAKRIKGKIPKGYQIRFPTEAEHEYALKSGGSRKDDLFAKYHVGKDEEKQVIEGQNHWMIGDMRTPTFWHLCFQDTVGSVADDDVSFEGGTIKRLRYEKTMIDPIWMNGQDGEDTNITWQGGWCMKGAYGKGHGMPGKESVVFHIAIAPSINTLTKYPKKKK